MPAVIALSEYGVVRVGPPSCLAASARVSPTMALWPVAVLDVRGPN
jgi:hypothetical protein